ncbi:glycosyltransferase [Rhodobacteraceae bacterium XHP0102]|nr:glycosyltransferase [Rhodobacteraceae bacterium XHP0102]
MYYDAHPRSHDIRNSESTLRKKRVAIILGYFNGQSYIKEQLNSIFRQTHKELHVFIFDDASKTPISLDGLIFDQHPTSKITLTTSGDNVGFTSNFLGGLASIHTEFEYFAFADQDDIWHNDKLDRAIKALETIPSDTPALYCARTEIADAICMQTLGYSPRFNKPPSFANALVQNIGGGNTMVFNRAARDLIINAAVDKTVVSHDWWSYQIVSGAGGCVVYDPEPCLKYRQHEHNIVGANTSWRARFLRIRGLLQGRFRAWNDINLKALSEHSHVLTADNRKILSDFIEARQSSLIKRLFLFKRSGIYRQTLFGNLGLLLGIILNKV